MKVARWPVASAYILMALAVLTFRPAQTGGPFLRDFEAYWSAGATANAHADPYGRAIWNAERGIPGLDGSRDELLPFVGPPATLLLWKPLARLPYVDAARVWFVILLAAALALATAALRASGERLSWAGFIATAALALAFGPLTSDLALGQIALLAFLAALLVTLPMVATARSGLPAAIAAFVALLQPNVAMGLISQLGRARTALAVGLAAAGAYLAGAAVSGWSWPRDYAQQLLTHDGVERFSVIQITPAAIAHGFGAPPAASVAIAAVAAAAAVTAAILLWRHISNAFARFAAFSALTPFAASFFHEHDLIVAFAAAVWCAVRARGIVRALALAATLWVAVDWLGLAQRPTGIVQSALLGLAVAGAFAARNQGHEWRATLAALAVTGAIFAFAAGLAAAHPAPVWPDALGSFHAPPDATVPQVWYEEQRRSGLLAISPAWAFLRTLSLGGCALLAVCVALDRSARA
ncbi:MAG TPA: glycosyltransferase 87 family protein [Candidatus Tumulicola sp.]